MYDMGATLGIINVTIDRVTAIANAKLPGAEDDVRTHSNDFRAMPVTTADFSDVPLARAMGQQHEAAREIFETTIEGVLKDLQEFRAALVHCMKNHEATDDNAQQALAALGARYAGHHYHSSRNWNRGREEHSDRLMPTTAARDGADSHPGSKPDHADHADHADQPGDAGAVSGPQRSF